MNVLIAILILANLSVTYAQNTEENGFEDNQFELLQVEVSDSPEKPQPPTEPEIPASDNVVPKKKPFIQFNGAFGGGLVTFKTPQAWERTPLIIGSTTVKINEGRLFDGYMRFDLSTLYYYRTLKGAYTAEDSHLFEKTLRTILQQAQSNFLQFNTPLPSLQESMAQAHAAVKKHVDEVMSKPALLDAAVREIFLRFNKDGLVEIIFGKVNPEYFFENPFGQHRISAPTLRVASTLGCMECNGVGVRVYMDMYDSRKLRQFSNPAGMPDAFVEYQFENYKPGEKQLTYNIKESREIGLNMNLLKQQVKLALGKRGTEIVGRYGVLDYRGAPLSILGEKFGRLTVNFQYSRENLKDSSHQNQTWREQIIKSKFSYEAGKGLKVYMFDLRAKSTNAQKLTPFNAQGYGVEKELFKFNGGSQGVKSFYELDRSRKNGTSSTTHLGGLIFWF